MSNKTFFPTSHIATVDSYPYGRLRCTAYFGTEFVKGKGFRSTFQTIDPKNGRVNKPKKSTYYDLSLMYEDSETGHYKHWATSIHSLEDCAKVHTFVMEHFDLWTPAELVHIAGTLVMAAKGEVHAIVVYCGANVEAATKAMTPTLEALVKAYGNPTRENFEAIVYDVAGFESLKVDGYNPFKVHTYGVE